MSQHKCHLCEQITNKFPRWDLRFWACRPCWNNYVNYRRAFKIEHGRFPKVAEYLAP